MYLMYVMHLLQTFISFITYYTFYESSLRFSELQTPGLVKRRPSWLQAKKHTSFQETENKKWWEKNFKNNSHLWRNKRFAVKNYFSRSKMIANYNFSWHLFRASSTTSNIQRSLTIPFTSSYDSIHLIKTMPSK